MRKAARAQWIANFDIEPLVSRTLQAGMLISMGLILAGLVAEWLGQGSVKATYFLRADSIPLLVLADFRRLSEGGAWPRILMDLGIAVLMLTSYLRVGISMTYFSLVDRSWKQAVLTGIVLSILTVILLTDWV